LAKVRKVVRDLGLDYQKIHACVNDCVLFRGKFEKLDNCPTCGEIRWKNSDSEGKNAEGCATGGLKKRSSYLVKYFGISQLHWKEVSSDVKNAIAEDIMVCSWLIFPHLLP
jgi:hypothetical protein